MSKFDKWIVSLEITREECSSFRDEILYEIIEFLKQTRTHETLSATAQMSLADPPVFPGINTELKRDLFELKNELAELKENVKHMECHNEVQEKRVTELRCLHADEIRRWSDELSDLEQS